MEINNFQNNLPENDNRVKRKPDWYYATAKFAQPNLQKAVIQLLDTFTPYLVLLALMVLTIKNHFPYWITLILGILAGGLLVRIFVIFHDCVHNSFFASRHANRILGYICGFLTCTPYDDWQWANSKHHATAGDLDNRGYGSVWMMTLDEYRKASWFMRFNYRLYRNPFVLFGIGPELFFLILNRFSCKGTGPRQHRSVLITNLAILAIFSTAIFFLGFANFFLIAAPIWIVSTSTGVWLFYIQHQFQGVYWARHSEWDVMTVALKGCSYYKLPKPLQWLTANIGIHNAHHLRTAIPNYNLQLCYDQTPELQELKPLTIRESLSAYRLKLWDEKNLTLIPFPSRKSSS